MEPFHGEHTVSHQTCRETKFQAAFAVDFSDEWAGILQIVDAKSG